jgi:hypothetical protein
MATSATTFTCTTCGNHTLHIKVTQRKLWRLLCDNGHVIKPTTVGDEIIIESC